MTVALKFGRDANSFNAYAPKPADIMYSVSLAKNTEVSVVLPGTDEVYCVSFRYLPGSAIWVDTTGAAASAPAGGTFAATTSELNPASLTLPAGTNISMITDYDVSEIGVVAWRIA